MPPPARKPGPRRGERGERLQLAPEQQRSTIGNQFCENHRKFRNFCVKTITQRTGGTNFRKTICPRRGERGERLQLLLRSTQLVGTACLQIWL